MIHSFYFKFILLGALIMSVFFSLNAQDNNHAVNKQSSDNYSIRWISQYPAIKNKKETNNKLIRITNIFLGKNNNNKSQRRNKNWFTNLIFGKKPSGLIKPMSILANNPDTFWVADQGTGAFLQVFDRVGEITQFRNKNIESIPSIDSSCFIPDNKILFTDSKLNKIFQLKPGNKSIQILNDSISLEQPTGIAYSAENKQIWVVETKAHRMSILNKKGELIKQFGKRGNEPGQFNFPTYIWIDKMGTVFVVDAMNFRIQIFDKNGEFISLFGGIGDASGYFARPKGVATDSFGHIIYSRRTFPCCSGIRQNR